MNNNAFQPSGAQGATPSCQANIAVTTAVQQLTLPAGMNAMQGGAMRIIVDGTSNVAWAYGVASGLTIGNGVHMLANTVETFYLPPGVTQISLIGASTGSTVRVVCGDGT